MISITQHIQYLIARHDFVSVPGFGAFIACSEPAKIASGNMFLPPHRSVGFNATVTHDDGLLIGSVARRERVSYEQAKTLVSDAVELMLRRIDIEGSLEIERVGIFERIEDSALSFQPVQVNNVASCLYGALRPVTLIPLYEEANDTANVVELELNDTEEYKSRRSWRFVAKYAASVAVLLGMCLTLSTPISIDDSEVAKASLAISTIKRNEPATVCVEKTISATQEDVAAPKVVLSVDEMAADTDYNCYVIVASCASRRGANRFIKHCADNRQMGVLHSDGRYRVYIAASNDAEAAYTYKETPEVASLHPDAWVYEKK